MKKLFAALLAICLMATTFCVTAFAAETGSKLNLNLNNSVRFGSIFSSGSLAMIIAILALAAAGFSIFLTLHLNKKKGAPTEDESKEEDESEE